LSISFSLFSQIIDRTNGYPPGTIIKSLPSDEYEIILPPLLYNESYPFTVPIESTYDANTITIFAESLHSLCVSLESTTTSSVDNPNKIINITPGQFCNDDDTLILEVRANHPLDGNDYQFYKLPVNRLPVKTVLVLDISGSMSTVESSGSSRWDILKKSVEVFTRVYETFKQDGDELGMTYFTNYLIQPNAPIENGFIEVTDVSANPSTEDTVKKDMNSRHPLNTTAMGLGLLDAKTKLKADVTNSYRKITLLFTDGLQNVPPFITPSDGNSTYGTGSGPFLNDYSVDNVDSIRYFTIATWGATAGPTPVVLSNIANNSNAYPLVVSNTSNPPGNAVYSYFNSHLTNILHGGSPQIIGVNIGKLNANELIHTFHLNSYITKAAFILTFEENDQVNLVIEKDGTDITDQITIINEPFYKIAVIDFPITGDNPIFSEGEYKVKLTGTTQNYYELTCIADDHYFNYECNMDKSIYKTGDTIQFNTNLLYGGTPLTSNTDSVKVILLKPGDDINHLLSIYEIPALENGEDDGSPVQEKFEYLYNNNQDFYDALIPNSQIIKLTNDGNGNFKGTYSDTYLTGVYEVIFLIKGEIADKGIFERRALYSKVFIFGKAAPVDVSTFIDTIAPPAPANIIATNTSAYTIDLSWNAPSITQDVNNYNVYKNGTYLLSTSETNSSIQNLTPGTSYEFYVDAEDASNNHSVASNTISVSTQNESDRVAPSKPLNFGASNISHSSIYLSWDASTDLSGIMYYTVYKNNEPLFNTTNISSAVTGLTANTAYAFYVTASDFAYNESEKSEILNVTTLTIPDALSPPAKLIAYDITETTLKLRWIEPKNSGGILEYYIFQNNSLIGISKETKFNVTSLKPATKYAYFIIARDKKGKLSDESNTISISTLKKSFGKEGILGLKIRPKNKYGYYLGPGFKSSITFNIIAKKSQDNITHKASIIEASSQPEGNSQPYLKNIVDNLDGSYYLILANVQSKSNPDIEILINNEVVYNGPVYGIPLWYKILVIILGVILLILILLKKTKSSFFKILLLIFLILVIIWYLHISGKLFFLFLI